MIVDAGAKRLAQDVDTGGMPIRPFEKMGYNWFVDLGCAALGNTGDFETYVLAIESEFSVQRSTHYGFRDNATAFRVFASVGGQPTDGRAFSQLGGFGS